MATLPNESHMHDEVPIANRLPLYGMFVSTAISGVGSALSGLALPWFVLEVSGSAGQAGLTAAAATLPIIIAGVFGGTLVDRVGYRVASVAADLASGVTTALIPLLYLTVGLELWQLLALVFLGNLLDAPGITARRALIPELAEEAGMPLARCNGMFEAVNRTSTLVGPLLAGVLIALIEASMVLWIDAATFGVSAVMVALVVPARLALGSGSPEAEPRASYFGEMLAGFRWIWNDKVLLSLVLAVLLTNVIESPLLIALTVYFREVVNSSVAFGVVAAALGAGQIIGALLSERIERALGRRWLFPVGFFAFVVVLAAFLVQAPLPVIVVLIFAGGLATGPLNPMLNTIFQERVPRGMRGRVFGLRGAMMMGAYPLGIAIGGGAIDAFGLSALLATQVILMSVAVVWMATSPRFRQLDPPDQPVGLTSAPATSRAAPVDADPSAAGARDG